MISPIYYVLSDRICLKEQNIIYFFVKMWRQNFTKRIRNRLFKSFARLFDGHKTKEMPSALLPSAVNIFLQ